MTTHWTYVAMAWGTAGATFAALTLMALARYRTAKRQLDRLEARR